MLKVAYAVLPFVIAFCAAGVLLSADAGKGIKIAALGLLLVSVPLVVIAGKYLEKLAKE